MLSDESPKVVLVPLSIFFLSFQAKAQGFDATVLPITDVRVAWPGMQLDFGTGFCLNTPCTAVVTTYHFEAMAIPVRSLM